MGSAASREAVGSIRNWAVTEGRKTSSQGRATELFGSLVFNDEVQRAAAARSTSTRRCAARSRRARRSTRRVADVVATAMKDWAIEHGATHYTHWFQPMTGITAEKHDSFLSPDGDGGADRRVQRQGAGPGRARRLELPLRRHPRHVRGPRLHRLGPDQPAPSSSRTPTARRSSSRPRSVSWTGEALDKKTPLLRSMEALSKQARAHPQAVRLDAPSASSRPSAPSRNTS